MITTIITHSIAAVAGAIALYLVLRNNPRWKTRADTLADQAEQLAKSQKNG